MGLSTCTSDSDSQRCPVKVFLLIENRILRETLTRLLRKRTELRVVGQCPYSDNATTQVAESLCDILLLDQSTLTSSSPDVTVQIAASSPNIKIILFGMDEERERFLRAVQSGAVGYLLKDASTSDIIAAVRTVAQGEAVCPPRLCLDLFEHVARESRVTPRMLNQRLNRKFGLTRRQQELVPLVAMGFTNKEIASRLNLSECTIKNHVHRLLKQVDAGSRYEAIENIRASGFTVVTRVTAVPRFPD